MDMIDILIDLTGIIPILLFILLLLLIEACKDLWED